MKRAINLLIASLAYAHSLDPSCTVCPSSWSGSSETAYAKTANSLTMASQCSGNPKWAYVIPISQGQSLDAIVYAGVSQQYKNFDKPLGVAQMSLDAQCTLSVNFTDYSGVVMNLNDGPHLNVATTSNSLCKANGGALGPGQYNANPAAGDYSAITGSYGTSTNCPTLYLVFHANGLGCDSTASPPSYCSGTTPSPTASVTSPSPASGIDRPTATTSPPGGNTVGIGADPHLLKVDGTKLTFEGDSDSWYNLIREDSIEINFHTSDVVGENQNFRYVDGFYMMYHKTDSEVHHTIKIQPNEESNLEGPLVGGSIKVVVDDDEIPSGSIHDLGEIKIYALNVPYECTSDKLFSTNSEENSDSSFDKCKLFIEAMGSGLQGYEDTHRGIVVINTPEGNIFVEVTKLERGNRLRGAKNYRMDIILKNVTVSQGLLVDTDIEESKYKLNYKI